MFDPAAKRDPLALSSLASLVAMLVLCWFALAQQMHDAPRFAVQDQIVEGGLA